MLLLLRTPFFTCGHSLPCLEAEGKLASTLSVLLNITKCSFKQSEHSFVAVI